MFTKLTAAFKIVSNLDKITSVVTVAYSALVKLLSVLAFIEQQINDTKLGTVLEKYLPPVITTLRKIKSLVEKYGELFGVVPQPETVVQSLEDVDLEADLKKSIDELNDLLNKK